MFQLTYVSESKSTISFSDLNDILEVAKTRNSLLNITGCLVYYNGKFIQIIEGPQIEVLRLYDIILSDKRHKNVTLLWENFAERRFFNEWNMAFHNPTHNNIKQFVDNLIMFSELSEKSTSSLLSFWATVREVMGDGQLKNVETF